MNYTKYNKIKYFEIYYKNRIFFVYITSLSLPYASPCIGITNKSLYL